ncbi:MAG: DUF4351 domain-containing protein, partial [Polyangiales bacterium]
ASGALDHGRPMLYFDLIYTSLSEAARQALSTMDPAKYEYQSDFAKHYLAQGRAEGRAETLVKQLSLKFGPLSAAVDARVRGASADELDSWTERVLSAASLDEVLG